MRVIYGGVEPSGCGKNCRLVPGGHTGRPYGALAHLFTMHFSFNSPPSGRRVSGLPQACEVRFMQGLKTNRQKCRLVMI